VGSKANTVDVVVALARSSTVLGAVSAWQCTAVVKVCPSVTNKWARVVFLFFSQWS